MKRITLTDDLRTMLHGLQGPINLCDTDGFHLAVIEPTTTSDGKASLVTYTEELHAALGNIAEGIEISDQNGTLIARIAPSGNPDHALEMSTGELEAFKRRRAAGSRTYSTAEVLQRLRKV